VHLFVAAERILLLGEAQGERVTEGMRVHSDEFRYGPIFREVWLPRAIDPGRAKARLSEGVLTLVLPKPKMGRSTPRPRRASRATPA
jgi:HSP20 family molecular chaperone IbpA